MVMPDVFIGIWAAGSTLLMMLQAVLFGLDVAGLLDLSTARMLSPLMVGIANTVIWYDIYCSSTFHAAYSVGVGITSSVALGWLLLAVLYDSISIYTEAVVLLVVIVAYSCGAICKRCCAAAPVQNGQRQVHGDEMEENGGVQLN